MAASNSKSSQSSDIQRIEGMFSKAVWLIGIIWTLTLGGGAVAFVMSFSYLNSLIDSSEKKVESISKQAEEKINGSVDQATKELAAKVLKKIDIAKLVDDLKSDQIPKIKGDLESHIAMVKSDISKEFGNINTLLADLKSNKIPRIKKDLGVHVATVKSDIAKDLKEIEVSIDKTETKIQFYQRIIDQLIIQQKEAYGLRIDIAGLGIEPTIPKLGQPAQLQARISAPDLESSKLIRLKAEIEAFGKLHIRELDLLGKKDQYLSIPIVIPKKMEQSGLILGEGKYSLNVKIKSIDGKVLLTQSSERITVYQ